jgi:UDP-N-acetylglucosamine 2-epimerase
LGELRYWALLREAAVVVGNSSSGVIEAPIAGAAVVNVGDRQRGRIRFGEVTDVPADAAAIEVAVRAAIARGRAGASAVPEGPAAPRVIQALADWRIPRPARKRFRDLECR